MKKVFLAVLTIVLGAAIFVSTAMAADFSVNYDFESGEFEEGWGNMCSLNVVSSHSKSGEFSLLVHEKGAPYATPMIWIPLLTPGDAYDVSVWLKLDGEIPDDGATIAFGFYLWNGASEDYDYFMEATIFDEEWTEVRIDGWVFNEPSLAGITDVYLMIQMVDWANPVKQSVYDRINMFVDDVSMTSSVLGEATGDADEATETGDETEAIAETETETGDEAEAIVSNETISEADDNAIALPAEPNIESPRTGENTMIYLSISFMAFFSLAVIAAKRKLKAK